jgi:hypothetical protein
MDFCVRCGTSFTSVDQEYCAGCGKRREQPPQIDPSWMRAVPGDPVEAAAPTGAAPPMYAWYPPDQVETATGIQRYRQPSPVDPGWQPPIWNQDPSAWNQDPDRGAPGPDPARNGPSRWPLLVFVLVLLAIGGGAWLTLRPQPAQAGPHAASPAGSVTGSAHPPRSPAGAGSASAPNSSGSGLGAAAKTQLGGFVVYLKTTAAARTGVVAAVSAVGACTESPATGIATLQSAATARTAAASSAGQLPVGAVPGGTALRDELVSLLQDSASADSSYVQWMQDIETAGCPLKTHTDPGLQAADTESAQATADKQQFVGAWNPLAREAGFSAYTADQL